MEIEDWIHQPQEVKGTHDFSGKFFATAGVVNLLSEKEIKAIYMYIVELAKKENGLDYLQVFIHKTTKKKLFFIDALNREMLASGGFDPEHHYCTLLLAEEY